MSNPPIEKATVSDIPAQQEGAAEHLQRLWQEGQRPEVDAFLAGAGPLPPAQLAAVLRVDQRQRWRSGERIPAESYLRRFPQVATDTDAALDLIFSEFLLREQLGERPAAEEYFRRFPEHEEVLSAQVDLHRALATAPGGSTLDIHAGTSMNTPPPPGPDLTTLRETFGRYRIVKVLGRGGMGTVYLAHDNQLDRPVALKVPRFELGGNLLERFHREARIAATFTHPSLCPVYDVGHINGVHYLTMPLVSGEALSTRIKREGALPQKLAARWTRQIARAIAVAHQAGVIHRDLKPANIMITEKDEPVVMDFGLARRGSAHDPRVTASGAMVGTPAYSPPEQIGGRTEAMGPTSDVYSLGAVLYEMLTGRLPFEGGLEEVVGQILSRDPHPPSRYRPDLDPRLEAICLKALAKEPRRRFASMGAFADTLDDYLENRPDSPVLARRRLRRLLLLAGGVVLSSLLGWLVCAFLLPSGQSKVKADLLTPGSHWTGRYRWSWAKEGETEEAELEVTKRDGEKFEGRYSTLGGQFLWDAEGTLQGRLIHWKLTRLIQPKDRPDAGRDAEIEGTLEGDTMDLKYKDHNSSATLTLQLKR